MSWLYTIVMVGMMFSHNAENLSVQRVIVTPEEPAGVQTGSQQTETERIEKSFPLNANGRVCVSNVNGSINVIAWDRNEVKLIAVKTADTKEHLANVDIKIDAREDYISIESDYGDNRDWKNDSDHRWKNNGNVSVDYELSVPRGAMLNEVETVNGSVSVADFNNLVKISAVNGTVKAMNLRGTAELSTVNGEVFADFDKLAPGSKIALETVNGRVNLTIPSDSSATVKAESLNGPITATDFNLPSRRGKYVGNSLYGRLGNGDVAIKLESVNGPLTVKRKNDGRPLSPSTNLLPPKGADEDGNIDIDIDQANVAKANKEISRNVRESERKALLDAQREVAKIKTDLPRVTEDALKEASKSIDSKEFEDAIKESLDEKKAELDLLRDANFFSGIPRIQTKENAFAVKGTPKVTIDAKGCSVRVQGTDSSEVRYSITQLKNGPQTSPPTVTESHSDSIVTIKVVESGDSPSSRRIEVFVPRKSNLKIISDGEVRLTGVSGELEIVGGDEPVNVRDSDGKLNITNVDGLVRVIGFDGDVVARTSDGEVFLEGKFSRLTGRAQSGSFTLTLPAGTNADVSSNTEVEAEGFDLSERGSNKWRLGSGGANYSFDAADGKVVIRNSATLTN